MHGQKSQIDFILVDNWTSTRIENAEAGKFIDMGSDHTAVKALLKLTRAQRKKRRKPTRQSERASWPPNDLKEYQKELDRQLGNADDANGIQAKYDEVEKAFINASNITKTAKEDAERDDKVLKQLLERRRAILSDRTQERAQMSKQIRKEVRRKKEDERSIKISETLDKFSEIEQIKAIKSRMKVNLAMGMKDK